MKRRHSPSRAFDASRSGSKRSVRAFRQAIQLGLPRRVGDSSLRRVGCLATFRDPRCSALRDPEASLWAASGPSTSVRWGTQIRLIWCDRSPATPAGRPDLPEVLPHRDVAATASAGYLPRERGGPARRRDSPGACSRVAEVSPRGPSYGHVHSKATSWYVDAAGTCRLDDLTVEHASCGDALATGRLRCRTGRPGTR